MGSSGNTVQSVQCTMGMYECNVCFRIIDDMIIVIMTAAEAVGGGGGVGKGSYDGGHSCATDSDGGSNYGAGGSAGIFEWNGMGRQKLTNTNVTVMRSTTYRAVSSLSKYNTRNTKSDSSNNGAHTHKTAEKNYVSRNDTHKHAFTSRNSHSCVGGVCYHNIIKHILRMAEERQKVLCEKLSRNESAKRAIQLN